MAATLSILLVDDTRFYLEIEKGFLRRTEAELLTARNGVEALDLIRRLHPDQVYMDQDLPGMDGAACCRQIKNDAVMKIPVIMIHDLSNKWSRPVPVVGLQCGGCSEHFFSRGAISFWHWSSAGISGSPVDSW